MASLGLALGCPCFPCTGELKTRCSSADALSHRNTPEHLIIVEGTIILNPVQMWDKRIDGLCPYKLVSYMTSDSRWKRTEMAVPNGHVITFSWHNM